MSIILIIITIEIILLIIIIVLIVKIRIIILVIVKIIVSLLIIWIGQLVQIVLIFVNFLNSECVNIYVTWYRLYNFLLGGRDADIIDFDYKMGMSSFFYRLITKSFLVIILQRHSWFDLRLSFTEILFRVSTWEGLLFPTTI